MSNGVVQTSARIVRPPEMVLGALKRRHDIRPFPTPSARSTIGSFELWLFCPEIAMSARPGQFVMVTCGADTFLPRPFSILSANELGELGLLFSAWEDGKGTRWLSERYENELITITGPLGNGFRFPERPSNLLLISGGIGIAPLRFAAEVGVQQESSVKLLMGASGEWQSSTERNPCQLYSTKRLPQGIEVRQIECSRDGTAGLVTELLSEELLRWADQVFACGPVPMYRTLAGNPLLKDKPVQVSLEVRMACGLGLCYGCSIKTRHGMQKVCRDGPVFDLADIIWEELADI